MSYKEIIDNVSNIEDLDNVTILKVLENFSKTIKDFAIEQSGLNNLVNVEFIPSDNNTTYTGDSVDYLGTLKLTLSDNIIVNKSCNIKFNIKGSNTIVVNVDEFNNSLELHLDNSVVTTLDFAESERQKSETDGAIVHEKKIADVEHIELLYDKSSSDANINKGLTSGCQFNETGANSVSLETSSISKYKGLNVYVYAVNQILKVYLPVDKASIETACRTSFAGQNEAINDSNILYGSLRYRYGNLYPSSIRERTLSSENIYQNNSNYYVSKIEGVY